MRIQVRYFAAAREAAGVEREELELPDGANVEQLLTALLAVRPALKPIASALRLAVDQEFAEPADPLRDGAEVALIPPVAGGSGSPRVKLSPEPLSLDAVVDAVRAPGLGGVVTFTGAVRSENKGKQVLRLEYEAYAGMAEKVFAQIATKAKERFGAEVAIHHRVGTLQVGEVAVVIAAAAAHRAEAFEACRFAIDALKQDAPIWKKEFTTDGAVWVGLGP